MSFVNWKTALFGALAAALPYVADFVPADLAPLVRGGASFALLLLGYFAKDKNVTGGNVRQFFGRGTPPQAP